MKTPRTFTQRWNPTALRRILRDYRESTSTYLCHSSPEFQDLWGSFKAEIKHLASAANIPNCRVDLINDGSVLFLPPDDLMPDEIYHWCDMSHNLRIAFLKHEIKRLTKKH